MATTWEKEYQTGSGWEYDDINITYDNGAPVFYDAYGVATTWTAENEPS